MKTRSVAAKKKTEETKADKPRVVGEVVMVDLTKVKPNAWNPNEMTEFERASLKHGLQSDGWMKSQSLLIWGTDEKGRVKNVIIDGEQRWTVANDIGFKKGPMVFLEKMTEAQAKALTVKLDQKRGKFNQDKLGLLLREIQYVYADDFAINIGIQDEELMPLLAEPEVVLSGEELEETEHHPPAGANSGIPTSSVRMVQLFLNPETHTEFNEHIRKLSAKYGTNNVSDTVLEAIRHAAGAASNKN